ncbi:hypothetical protein MaudCBS49596_002215 [Microsporum audouinii]
MSKPGATAMTAIMTSLSIFCGMTNMATASRQLFAFARDNGLPFGKFFQKVPLGWDIPLNAIIFTVIVSSLLSLINIGSTIAFNQITSLGLCALLSSYIVSISCMALKRIRGEALLPSHFRMGALGLPINLLSLAFLVLAYVFCFFPPTPKPPLDGANQFGHAIPAYKLCRRGAAPLLVELEVFDFASWPQRPQYNIQVATRKALNINGQAVKLFGPEWILREKVYPGINAKVVIKDEVDIGDISNMMIPLAVEDRPELDFNQNQELQVALENLLQKRPDLTQTLKAKIKCSAVFETS